MKQKQVTKCCGSRAVAVSAVPDEGTSYYLCKMCNNPTDVITQAEFKLKKKINKLEKKITKNNEKRDTKAIKKELWKVTSAIVRAASSNCYTCDKYIPDISKRHAGHFWTKGGHPRTYYDMDNIRVQCYSCNVCKSGNLAEYGSRLRREIGSGSFDALELRAHSKDKLSTECLLDLLSSRRTIISKL